MTLKEAGTVVNIAFEFSNLYLKIVHCTAGDNFENEIQLFYFFSFIYFIFRNPCILL